MDPARRFTRAGGGDEGDGWISDDVSRSGGPKQETDYSACIGRSEEEPHRSRTPARHPSQLPPAPHPQPKPRIWVVRSVSPVAGPRPDLACFLDLIPPRH